MIRGNRVGAKRPFRPKSALKEAKEWTKLLLTALKRDENFDLEANLPESVALKGYVKTELRKAGIDI